MANNITTVRVESDSVTLKKDSKGNYSWEIKKYGDDFSKILTEISKADTELRVAYINGGDDGTDTGSG